MMRLLGGTAIAVFLIAPSQAGEAIHGVWVRSSHPLQKARVLRLRRQTLRPGNHARRQWRAGRDHHTARLPRPRPTNGRAICSIRKTARFTGGTVTLDKPNQFTLTGCLIERPVPERTVDARRQGRAASRQDRAQGQARHRLAEGRGDQASGDRSRSARRARPAIIGK